MSDRYLQMDAATLERELANVIAAYPDLAEDADLRADTLEGLGLNEMLSRLVSAAQDAGCLSDAIKSRIDGLAKRKDAAERREEGLRSLILRLMQATDVRKVQLPEATLSIARVPPAAIIHDARQLPEAVMRQRWEINKPAIKEALERGEDVPGAHMTNGGERLTVRVG